MKQTGLTHKGTLWSEISTGLSKDDAAAQGNACVIRQWLLPRLSERFAAS
jgi:hypothetical protein